MKSTNNSGQDPNLPANLETASTERNPNTTYESLPPGVQEQIDAIVNESIGDPDRPDLLRELQGLSSTPHAAGRVTQAQVLSAAQQSAEAKGLPELASRINNVLISLKVPNTLRAATSFLGAAEDPQSIAGKSLNASGPVTGTLNTARGIGETVAITSAAGIAATTADVLGAEIPGQDIMKSGSNAIADAIGEPVKLGAEQIYEALPEWMQIGAEIGDLAREFSGLGYQFMSLLLNQSENADNALLLGKLAAVMMVSQAIAGGLTVIQARRTRLDRILTASVKAAVASCIGYEGVEALNGWSSPLVEEGGIFNAEKVQELWGWTALKASGLIGLWAAWDAIKAYQGEVGLAQRRKGGWLDAWGRKDYAQSGQGEKPTHIDANQA